jgi:hypothetical protein
MVSFMAESCIFLSGSDVSGAVEGWGYVRFMALPARFGRWTMVLDGWSAGGDGTVDWWLGAKELTGSVDGVTDTGVGGGTGGDRAGGVEDRRMVAAELARDVCE